MRFKRSINTVLAVVFVIIAIAWFGYTLLMMKLMLYRKVVVSAVFMIILIVVWILVPPDFDYEIMVREGFVIIKTSRDDERHFDRETLKIVDQTPHKIILYDGYEKAKLNYNDKMLKFLKEIIEF